MASTATATLAISPFNSITGSTHQITVTATSDCGRGKQATYNLDLQTEPKPASTRRLIREWTSGIRQDENGTTTCTTSNLKDETVSVKRYYVKLSIVRHREREYALGAVGGQYFPYVSDPPIATDVPTGAMYGQGDFDATLEEPEYDTGP